MEPPSQQSISGSLDTAEGTWKRMEPTPATTVHARPAAARTGRRAGVGRAPLVTAAGLLVAALVSGPVLAATPRQASAASDPTPIPVPGLEDVLPPVPETTPAPATIAAPAPATGEPVTTDPVAPEAGIPSVVLGVFAVALILLLTLRRSRAPEPQIPAPPVVVQQPDHEQLLADALAARAGRRRPSEDGDKRPVWVRRLEAAPAPQGEALDEPDPDIGHL